MTAKRWMLAGLAILIAATVSGGPLAAQTAIKVIVNNKPITTYDINQRSSLLRLTGSRGGAKQATEELIEEVLKMQEAERAGIRITKADVDEAYATLASRVKLTPARLTQALAQSGVKAETMRQRIQAEIAWSQLLRARFQSEVRISESDVIAALRKQEDKSSDTSMEYRIQPIIFVVPAKTGASGKNQRRRDVENFRSRFSSCNEAQTLASEFREVVVMPMVTRLETEVPAALKEALDKTAVGKVTTAQDSSKGLEVYAVCDKREIASNAAARMEVEDELRNKEGEQMSRRYMRELRSRAIIDYR